MMLIVGVRDGRRK